MRDAEEKAQLNSEADETLQALRTIADLVLGCALRAELDGQASPEDQIAASAQLVAAAVDSSQSADLRRMAVAKIESRSRQALDAGRPPTAPLRKPLHWPLSFPEVFGHQNGSGFDAMVANPPYMGNKYWKERVGPEAQPVYSRLIGRRLGKPDLIVLFVYRMASLVKLTGCIGTLSTQSITEVDSKELMQAVVLRHGTIYRAVRSRPWPGAATVIISQLWLYFSDWRGAHVLNGSHVPAIGADLREEFGAEPEELYESMYAFEGVHNARGLAFVVPRASVLRRHNVFKPYVSGEDLTQANFRSPERWVLDLTGWSKAQLASLPKQVQDFLFVTVQPKRTVAELRSYRGLAERWWTYWNTRETGFRIAREQESCVAVPSVAKYLVPLALPSEWVFTNMAVVIARTRNDVHALLLSPPFDVWAEKYGGTMGQGRRMKVGPVIRTFPLPASTVKGDALGDEWQNAAASALLAHGPGLTQVLNAVHDPACMLADVQAIRRAYQDIASAVLQAYGWSDLDEPFSQRSPC